jgi:hypothetical protein
VAAAAATLALAGVVALGVLLSRQYLHPTTSESQGIEAALTSGAPASIGPVPGRAFVWMTSMITKPTTTPDNGSEQVTGLRVYVLDWSGKLRHQFDLLDTTHGSGLGLMTNVQSVSSDGTRAILGDGRVIDETGATVASVAALKSNGLSGQNYVHWMPDGRGLCAAFSNQPVGPEIAMPPKGQANPSATPLPTPPWAAPGADHSVTLKVFGLNGSVRTVARFGAERSAAASGTQPDQVSVLACNPATDLAVVARYHDAGPASYSQPSTNLTASLWAIKLSTGAVLGHTAETRMALGRAFFFGSENGQLAVEFLWNSRVLGAETDVVLQMPSGQPVPVIGDEPATDTAGLSADGSRILKRVFDQTDSFTILKLVDASDGRVIRQVRIPTIVGATAVAMPGGSAFMVQVADYVALVDSDGGISLLHPNVPLKGRNAAGLMAMWTQG